jgi:hypothetical protein
VLGDRAPVLKTIARPHPKRKHKNVVKRVSRPTWCKPLAIQYFAEIPVQYIWVSTAASSTFQEELRVFVPAFDVIDMITYTMKKMQASHRAAEIDLTFPLNTFQGNSNAVHTSRNKHHCTYPSVDIPCVLNGSQSSARNSAAAQHDSMLKFLNAHLTNT